LKGVPAIEKVTVPLVVRFGDGIEKVVAAAFPDPAGLLYLDLFWHLRTPTEAAHLVPGELHGEGPWKVGKAVVRVLGCHNTDPDLHAQFSPWQEYLEAEAQHYPPRAQILEIARRLGARV
jgi:hypothetical protein